LWPKAYREQDTTLLDSLLDDSFQMIDDQGGWYKKADEIAWISKNKPSYERFHYEIKRLDIYRNGTAVISGIGHMEGTDKEGKSYHTTYHSSNVLIKLDGEWKAINSHVSGIKRE
jgi:ketosteroid isomerase-like protein